MGNTWAIFQLLSFSNYKRTEKMLEKKSLLNPNASPYIPVSKCSSNDVTKTTKSSCDNANCGEDGLKRSGNHGNNSTPNEDDSLQRVEKLDLPPECFSNLVISENFEDIFHADVRTPDQPNLIIESLRMMFPNTSMECIEEVLKLNHFDLGQTLSMLDELEDNDFEDSSTQLDDSQ